MSNRRSIYPTSAFVINPRRIKKDFRGSFITKLISSSLLTANRNEIDCAEPAAEMRRVIESFAQYARHCRNSSGGSREPPGFERGGSPEPPWRLRSIEPRVGEI